MGAPRGAGRAGLVTSGGGGYRKFIEFIKRKAGDGAEYVKKNVQTVMVWAKIVSVNSEKPKSLIQGSTSVVIGPSKKISVKMSGEFSKKVVKFWENVKITIARIK